MRRHVIWRGDEPATTIVVGRGVNDVLAEVVNAHSPTRAAVICQPTTVDLAERYANILQGAGLAVTGYTLPDGEAAKQLSVVEDVYKFLNKSNFTREDVIIGVGGGALTDVTGFIAATYLRGVPVVYVTTTLLGAVDASIGGKTAVNVDGKNLAGVFQHPDAVLVDVDVLDALPDALKVTGSAEAVKAGFIADIEIVEAYERDGIETDLEDIVNRAVSVKVDVVNEDFREQGKRAILNYGHTVGHGIEVATGRTHGDSVAIGMIAAGAASRHQIGFTGEQRQRDVLGKIGLPLDAPDAKAAQVRSWMALDKKRDASGLRMVLLQDFGSPVVVSADDATVQAALAAVGIS